MAKTPKRPRDPNQLAKLIVDIAAGEANKQESAVSPEAVATGRLGGVERAKRMAPERRAEVARQAAAVRWGRK